MKTHNETRKKLFHIQIAALAVVIVFSQGCAKKPVEKGVEENAKAHAAATAMAPEYDPAKCNNCHIKEKPVKGDAELKQCVIAHTDNARKIGTQRNEPEVVILDDLLDKYDPVRFTHKKHADMAQMSGSCWICHHNRPADKPHPECKFCHKIEMDRNNPQMIRLKAAYHRQCMDCHRKWSGGNDCKVCHAERGKGPEISFARGLKSPYPKMEQPKKHTYTTKNKKTLVTFLHNDHTNMFKIPCETCHEHAECGECHNRKKAKPAIKAGHAACSACHDTNSKTACAKCHRNEEMTAYHHDSAGFPLNKFHNKLPCNACHHVSEPIVKISSDCRSCHKGNSLRNFDHSKTGFSLSPYHRALDCEKCHPANHPYRNISAKCASCHKGKISDAFDHLKKHHASAACDKCHRPAGRVVARPDKDCASCHKEDAFKNLDHAKTVGVALDDIHVSLACTDCHTKGFASPVDCTACHGTDKSYPKDKFITK